MQEETNTLVLNIFFRNLGQVGWDNSSFLWMEEVNFHLKKTLYFFHPILFLLGRLMTKSFERRNFIFLFEGLNIK